MKYRFVIEYDSDSHQYILMEHSDDVDVEHSGSSYVRIKSKDDSFHGIIDCHHDNITCYEGGLKVDAPLKCKGAHCNIFIEKT